MNKVLWGLAVLFVSSTRVAQASSVSCSATFSISGCFTDANFVGMDFVNWGSSTAFGEAFQGMTSNGYTNAYNLGGAITTWDAQSQGGQTVSVSLVHPTSPLVLRTDNTLLAGDSTHWDLANAIVQEQYGSGYQIYTYAGHFGAPGSLPQVGYTGFGDALIGQADSTGAVNGLGPMEFTFNTPISAGGLRISSVGGTDSNFGAVLTAYDAFGSSWTYTIKAYGSGGQCSTLISLTPCDDAPWLGFTGLTGITHFTVDVFKLAENELTNREVGFLVDQLEMSGRNGFTAAPEPALMLLTGGALWGLVSLSRKRNRSPRV